MTIQESIDELKNEIASMDVAFAAPTTTVCTHVLCPACEAALAEEIKQKEFLRIKLEEKRMLYEKIKAYGSDEQS